MASTRNSLKFRVHARTVNRELYLCHIHRQELITLEENSFYFNFSLYLPPSPWLRHPPKTIKYKITVSFCKGTPRRFFLFFVTSGKGSRPDFKKVRANTISRRNEKGSRLDVCILGCEGLHGRNKMDFWIWSRYGYVMK